MHKTKKIKTCIFQKELYKYLIIYLDITFWHIFAVNGPSLTRIVFGFRIAITRGRLVSTQVTFIQMIMMLKITTKNIYLRYILQFYSVLEVYLSSFIGISMNRDFPSLKEIWMFAQNCIENLNPNYLCFICFFFFLSFFLNLSLRLSGQVRWRSDYFSSRNITLYFYQICLIIYTW